MVKLINNNWLLGFIEAEGTISFNKNLNKPVFTITQHIADYKLMEQIRVYLKINSQIKFSNRDLTCELAETNMTNLKETLVPILTNNLYSEKKVNQFNEHWKPYLHKSTMKKTSINFKSSKRNENKISIDWLIGMVDGDGSFFITITKSKDYKIGYQIRARFAIKQIDAKNLLEKINKEIFENKAQVQEDRLIIEDINIITRYVLPIFTNNRLKTRKEKDFRLWKEAICLIKNKEHLEKKGLEKIINIRFKMELNRQGIGHSI